MGWIHKMVPKPIHECNIPTEKSDKGSIWECDTCKTWYIKGLGLWHKLDRTREGLSSVACDKGVCILGFGHLGKCTY